MSAAPVDDCDKIFVVWHVDDVIERAIELGIEIGIDDGRAVLASVKKTHDACIGINWDVIDYHLFAHVGVE